MKRTKYAVGVMVSPRPVPTVQVTIHGLRQNGLTPRLFLEPGATPIPEVFGLPRPASAAGGPYFPGCFPSPSGRMGNFQNYVQMMADLLYYEPDAEAYLLCEDDARLCHNILPFLDHILWPHHRCGVVSLYAPKMFTYGSPFPMCKHIMRLNTVGGLASVFRPEVAKQMITHHITQNWKGDKRQQKGVNPWERKGSDAWIGNVVNAMGWGVYAFTPSLVDHYVPEGVADNSSVQNGPARGARTSLDYVGDKANLWEIFGPYLDMLHS